ncbi:MAG: hypothetical protein EU542_08000 [Promethearchaeota archaeon]|nr:MAG: hypothetical protein EU542_08000 [Candidatus Lokiarchaeota archaeon]
MINLGIEALLVMDKVGIPLLFQKLDPIKTDIEPVLLSGFLTAVKSFSDDLIDSTVSNFHINYGKRLVTIISGKKIIFAAIHNERFKDQIVPKLEPLLEEFEENYYEQYESGEPGDLNEFQPFHERIATVMGIVNPSDDWIPYLKSKAHKEHLQNKCQLEKLIDNESNIGNIITKSSCSRKTILEELSLLWSNQFIQFRNILTEKDIVIATANLSLYLQKNTFTYGELCETFPKIKNKVPFIISYLDGRTTVGEILQEFDSFGKETIYSLLDYFYVNDAISVLSSEKRRILMAKEILHESLFLATEMYSLEETLSIIRKVLAEINTPAVISQIKITKKSWHIDYSFTIYTGLTPKEILEIYNQWLNVLRLFIFYLDKSKRNAFIELLSDELDFDFFEKYRSEDMNGFEEFVFWLETLFK